MVHFCFLTEYWKINIGTFSNYRKHHIYTQNNYSLEKIFAKWLAFAVCSTFEDWTSFIKFIVDCILFYIFKLVYKCLSSVKLVWGIDSIKYCCQCYSDMPGVPPVSQESWKHAQQSLDTAAQHSLDIMQARGGQGRHKKRRRKLSFRKLCSCLLAPPAVDECPESPIIPLEKKLQVSLALERNRVHILFIWGFLSWLPLNSRSIFVAL